MKKINKKVPLSNNVDEYREKKNRQRLIRICTTLFISVVLVFSTSTFINLYTYKKYEVYSSIDKDSTHNFKYKRFSKGMVEYNVNGISYIEIDGKEKWNYSWNIKAPFLSVNDNVISVVDLNGYDVYIFNKDNFINHFKTKRKILKTHILPTTDVALLTEGEDGYFINIYKSSGEEILETKSGISNTGYIFDFNIDLNLNHLIVAYLRVSESGVYSTVNSYNIKDVNNKDKVEKTFQYDDEVVSKIFVDKNRVYVVSDKHIIGYDINKGWNEKRLDIINTSPRIYLADSKLVILSDTQKGVEIKVYDKNLEELLYKVIKHNYNEIRVFDDEICFIDDNKLIGYKFNGRKEYELSFNDKIWDVEKISEKNYVISHTNKTVRIKLKLF